MPLAQHEVTVGAHGSSPRALGNDAGASADALRAEWWKQPATNQTDEPRTTGTDGGAAGPMLDPHSVLDNLWGGRNGKLTEVGSGEYDVPAGEHRTGSEGL